MKIALVRPPTIISISEVRPGACPPLGLAYIAASLQEAGHQVQIIDAVGEALEGYSLVPGVPGVRRQGLSDDAVAKRIASDVELVGVSCMFSTEWPFAKALIKRIRSEFPLVKIVAGGEHISAVPEYVLNDCSALDFCGLGEGEHVMVDLAAALESGKDIATVSGLAYRQDQAIRRTPARKRVMDVESFPWPAWDLLPIRSYIDHGVTPGVDIGRSIPMLASRGCPYECTFCSNPFMWGQIWKPREQQKVLDEMKLYMEKFRVTNFDFYDLTAIVRKDWILKMAQLIIDNGLTITWQLPSGTRSEALDHEVVQALYRSGCRHIIYAPESGSSKMLNLIKKRINKARMAESIRGAVRNKIKTKANFIVGFPDETIWDVFQSYVFALRLAWAGLHDVSFFPFSAYPGSELFHRLEKEGKAALSDEHFYNLVRNPHSYDDHIPSAWVPVLAYIGIALFYFFSFLIRPIRLFHLARALWKKKPETRLESALLRVYKNRTRKVAQPPPHLSIH